MALDMQQLMQMLGGGISQPPGPSLGAGGPNPGFGGGINQPPGGFGGLGGGIGQPPGGSIGQQYGNDVRTPFGGGGFNPVQSGGMQGQNGGGIMQVLMHMLGGGQGGQRPAYGMQGMQRGNTGFQQQRPMQPPQMAYAGGSPTFNERTGFGGGINPPPGGNQVYPRPNAGINPVPMGGQSGQQSLAQIARPDMRIM